MPFMKLDRSGHRVNTTMPPRNVRGGKSYKKNKKADDNVREVKFEGRDSEQDYARVLSLLGNRRALCFCNDAKERICKIRGALCKGPKKQIITVGSIVLISFRDLEDEVGTAAAPASETPTGMAIASSTGRKEIADILLQYSRTHWRNIRAEPNIHPKLMQETATVGEDDIFEEDEEEEIDMDKI